MWVLSFIMWESSFGAFKICFQVNEEKFDKQIKFVETYLVMLLILNGKNSPGNQKKL